MERTKLKQGGLKAKTLIPALLFLVLMPITFTYGIDKHSDQMNRRDIDANWAFWIDSDSLDLKYNQMMARHKANHIQVVYAPDVESADKSLAAKAAMFAELGIEVHLCGDVKGG